MNINIKSKIKMEIIKGEGSERYDSKQNKKHKMAPFTKWTPLGAQTWT
jgi:hypothetical protein